MKAVTMITARDLLIRAFIDGCSASCRLQSPDTGDAMQSGRSRNLEFPVSFEPELRALPALR
jgi:hypothetical protein